MLTMDIEDNDELEEEPEANPTNKRWTKKEIHFFIQIYAVIDDHFPSRGLTNTSVLAAE